MEWSYTFLWQGLLLMSVITNGILDYVKKTIRDHSRQKSQNLNA